MSNKKRGTARRLVHPSRFWTGGCIPFSSNPDPNTPRNFSIQAKAGDKDNLEGSRDEKNRPGNSELLDSPHHTQLADDKDEVGAVLRGDLKGTAKKPEQKDNDRSSDALHDATAGLEANRRIPSRIHKLLQNPSWVISRFGKGQVSGIIWGALLEEMDGDLRNATGVFESMEGALEGDLEES